MAAAEVLDIPQLSSFCSLPPTSINTLLDTPTVELVRNLLENVSAKAREYEETKSANLKLSVELENAVRGGESKARILKNSVDKRLKEAEDLNKRLQAEGRPYMASKSGILLTSARTSKNFLGIRATIFTNIYIFIGREIEWLPSTNRHARIIQS